MTESRILLRIDEVARRLSISRAQAYQLAAAGVLPSIRIGRSRRVPESELELWVRERMQTTAEGKK